MVEISRRAFMQFTASAAALAAAAGLGPRLTPEESVELPAPGEASAPEFGFTFNDDIYQTGFPTRRMAIAAARQDALLSQREGFRVAQIIRPAFAVPDDLATTAVDWLINPGQLGNVLAQAVVDSNEDLDFEGELEDACFGIERASMGAEGRAAIADALARHGAAELANQVRRDTMSPNIDPRGELDKMLDALMEDKRLEADLWDAVQRWIIQNDIASAGNGLQVLEVEDHHVGETLADVVLAPPGPGVNVEISDAQMALL